MVQLPDDHYFSAVIDGKTVSRHPLETLRLARTAGVDLIAGTNADEWYMYVDESTTQKDLNDWVAENAPGQPAGVACPFPARPSRHGTGQSNRGNGSFFHGTM